MTSWRESRSMLDSSTDNHDGQATDSGPVSPCCGRLAGRAALFLSLVSLAVHGGLISRGVEAADKPTAKRSSVRKPTSRVTATRRRGTPQVAVPTAALTGSAREIVDYANKQLQQGWSDNEIKPSSLASDTEWIRRVHLDLIGAIPPLETVEAFLKDRDPAKRTKLIDNLLDHPGYVRNWTTIWSNLLIGRQTPRRVSRLGMRKFLREAFARNRPWDKVVFDLVSAEGHFERNGAVNYLLAQMTMNDDGVQATAKTTRLFMGIQVQCTQCHNHPFNDWKQNQFWEFNNFFRQARRVDHRRYDPNSGRMVDDYSELVFTDFNERVFFEQRAGTLQMVEPRFFETRVDAKPSTDLRKELAKLMVAGDNPYISRAMVNRMWGHFFGYGFTKPIDDMGPHNAPTHPELLDRLSREFVKAGYDIKQLARWICNAEAYHLTSRLGNDNQVDNPAAGESPLFSHMYVKGMEAEQLYDSLIVATGAHKAGGSGWEESERQRQTWLRQFVIAFGTDENDEATTFNGTIPQALMMMNGELVDKATSAERGSFLNKVLSGAATDAARVRRLFLSTLTREPSRRELQAAQQLLKENRDRPIVAYQDLYWALLNSNEFIFNH